MAMTREEEKELRLSCSIGTLLSSLGTREDLKMEPPSKEDSAENAPAAVKRKAKDDEESMAMDYFLEETPDFEEDDPDWVVAEKKYLIEEYGKKIVSLGFDERDRFVYTCEICSVECNQRKMLEAHCLGMKHLRKKKLHDLKIQGKEVPDSFKITKSNSSKQTKPIGPDKPNEEEGSTAKKKKWKESNNYYNYGQGNAPPFCNQPPPYGPPPGYGGAPPGFPPAGPPPAFYGNWPASTPNIFNTPPPSLDNSKATNKNSLAGGDTGSLLQKLADCAVKNDKDSELAINVVIALMKSLKDFNHKRGETKFIEVLTEADVTFRILKTLKPAAKEAEESVPAPSTSDVLQDQNSSSSTTCGVSDFAQSAPSNSQSSNYPVNNSQSSNYPVNNSQPSNYPVNNSQSSNYPVNNQYYNSQSNPSSNTGYNYGTGTGPDYSSQVPTGVPPPSATNYNSQGTNGYAPEGTDQNYGQNTAYSNQGSTNSNQANNQSYPTQNYSNQGYGSEGANTQNYPNQGYGNQGPNPQASSGYYNQQGQANSQVNSGYSNQGQAPYSQPTGDYYKGTPNTQSTEDSNSSQGVGQKDVGGESNQQPPANAQTPAPSATPAAPAASDSSTPDFSNYGYAAGYSMQ